MAKNKYVPPKTYAEFRGDHKDDMTAALYNIKVPESNELYKPSSQTVPELLASTVEKFGSRNAVGHRKVIKSEFVPADPEKPDGKQFEKRTLEDEYTWSTYEEYQVRVQNLAQGLAAFCDVKAKDSIAIYAETQEDWMTMAQAAWQLNLKVTTIYDTLGPDAAAFGMKQSACSVVVCNHKAMKSMVKIVENAKCVKSIIVIGEESVEVEGLKTESMEQLVKNGAELEEKKEFEAPKGEDIAVIMYTSGTTGNPKGVLISHKALTCQAEGSVKHFPDMNETEVHLAYLPLAHIMEIVIELGVCALGAATAYAHKLTLVPSGTALAPGSICDAQAARPSMFLFAPAVLDKFYNSVSAQIAGSSGLKKYVATSAIASGAKNQMKHKIGANAFWYGIGFKKASLAVGGQVKLAISGSAPLSPVIQQFCQTTLRCPVRQGYGLTESLASSCIADTSDNSTNSVGPPTTCTTIRLRDWAEGGYLVADKDNKDFGMPRGEVLIGGNAISNGYLVNDDDEDAEKMREKNREEYITVDGMRYFCTGDIGQITAQGNVMIIDRKKDLFKGATGEYVSLSKVESLMKVSPYVENPFVYGKQGEEGVIALVSPMPKAILELAESLGMDTSEKNIFELIKNKKILKAVSADINEHIKTLKRFEKPMAIRMCLDDSDEKGAPAFSPENGLCTAALKVKRPVVAKHYAKLIDEAYKSAKKVAKKASNGEAKKASNGEAKKASNGEAKKATEAKETPKEEVATKDAAKDKSAKKSDEKKDDVKAAESPKTKKKKDVKDDAKAAESPKTKKKDDAKKVKKEAESPKTKKKDDAKKEDAKATDSPKTKKKGDAKKEDAKATDSPKTKKKGDAKKEDAKKEDAKAADSPKTKKKGDAKKEDAKATDSPKTKKKESVKNKKAATEEKKDKKATEEKATTDKKGKKGKKGSTKQKAEKKEDKKEDKADDKKAEEPAVEAAEEAKAAPAEEKTKEEPAEAEAAPAEEETKEEPAEAEAAPAEVETKEEPAEVAKAAPAEEETKEEPAEAEAAPAEVEPKEEPAEVAAPAGEETKEEPAEAEAAPAPAGEETKEDKEE